MTPEKKFQELYKQMWDLCQENEWGDPFSYARAKEIYATCSLGHKMPGPNMYAGADGINQNGQPVEYKSTTGKKCQGSYTGISVHKTWREQEKYLITEKLGKYPEHYYNRFEDGKLIESWKLSGKKVLDILLPKLAKKFETVNQQKDPRLAATVTWKEIKMHGEQVI
jgi:hypothetical protein